MARSNRPARMCSLPALRRSFASPARSPWASGMPAAYRHRPASANARTTYLTMGREAIVYTAARGGLLELEANPVFLDQARAARLRGREGQTISPLGKDGARKREGERVVATLLKPAALPDDRTPCVGDLERVIRGRGSLDDIEDECDRLRPGRH